MTEASQNMLNESLSALVDGESNDLDLQRVLNALDGEDNESANEVRSTWLRYHSISSTMQNGQPIDTNVGGSIDLSASIREALDSEPAHAEVKRFSFQTLTNGVGKTAVAAAVTFGVIIGAQNFGTGALSQQERAQNVEVAVAGSDVTPVSTLNSGAVVPQGFELPPLTAQTVSTNSLVDPALAARNQARPPVVTIPTGNTVISNEAFQSQLDRLMFKHAEQSASSSALGAMPFARVSSFSDQDKE